MPVAETPDGTGGGPPKAGRGAPSPEPTEAAYALRFAPGAVRALVERLPEAVAAAAWELITGDLQAEPKQVGKPLRGELAGRWSARRGTYRVIYRIDDEQRLVEIVAVAHRADAYR